MPDERNFLPVQDRDDEYRLDHISDAIEATVSDPNERAVMRNIATNLLVDYGPDTIGDALDILDNSTNEARRAYYDRARTEASLPTLTVAKAQESLRTPVSTDKPWRDSRGMVDAFCGGCGSSEPGDDGHQFARKAVVRYWCESCLAEDPSREADMQPYTGPRYGYAPSGAVIDLDLQDAEQQKALREEQARQAARDRRRAEAEAEIAALEPFEQAREEQDAKLNRLQNPWAAA